MMFKDLENNLVLVSPEKYCVVLEKDEEKVVCLLLGHSMKNEYIRIMTIYKSGWMSGKLKPINDHTHYYALIKNLFRRDKIYRGTQR